MTRPDLLLLRPPPTIPILRRVGGGDTGKRGKEGDERSRREREREEGKKREREKERSRRKSRRGRGIMRRVMACQGRIPNQRSVGCCPKKLCVICLLQIIDDGQAVDIRGISERSLSKSLRKLFFSLSLKESGDGVFLRQADAPPVLDVVGFIIQARMDSKEQHVDPSASVERAHSELPETEDRQVIDDSRLEMPSPRDDSLWS